MRTPPINFIEWLTVSLIPSIFHIAPLPLLAATVSAVLAITFTGYLIVCAVCLVIVIPWFAYDLRNTTPEPYQD